MSLNIAQIEIHGKDNTHAAFESVEKNLDSLKESAVRIGEIIGISMSADAFKDFIKGSFESADQMGKMAQKAGVSIESLSRMSIAAQLADVDTETLAKGMGRLSHSVAQASSGIGMQAQAFDALGIKVRDTHGNLKNADVIIRELSEKFHGMEDGAGKTAAAIAILGKSGAELIPMLNGGSEELDKFANLSDKLGLTLDSKTSQAAQDVNDRFRMMGMAVKGVGYQLMTNMMPAMNQISQSMVDFATDGDTMKNISNDLTLTFKVLASAAMVSANQFEWVARGIGGLAAMANAAAHGNFSEAKTIWTQLNADQDAADRKFTQSIDKMWSQTAAAQSHAEQAHKSKFNLQLGGTTVDAANLESLKVIDKMNLATKDFTSGLEFQNSIVNMSTIDAKSANEQRTIQLKLEQELLAIKNNPAFKDTKNPSVAAAKKRALAAAELAADRQMKASANNADIAQDRLSVEVRRQIKVEEANRLGEIQAMSNTQLANLMMQGKLAQQDIDDMSMSQKIGSAISGSTQLLSMIGQHNKTAFNISKQFAAADALVSMYQGVAAGIKLGWPMGIPAVAWALVQGGSAISKIESAQFGGGSSGGAAPTGIGGVGSLPGQVSNPNVIGTPVSNLKQGATQPATIVNIYNTGNVLSADYIDNTVIAQIKSRISNADVTIIDPRSRQAQMLQAVPA
jgi:hypothetical protein